MNNRIPAFMNLSLIFIFIICIGSACTITVGETGVGTDTAGPPFSTVDCSQIGEFLVNSGPDTCICDDGYEWCDPNNLKDFTCCITPITSISGESSDLTTSPDTTTSGSTTGESTTDDTDNHSDCDETMISWQLSPAGPCNPKLDDLYCSNIRQSNDECEILMGGLYVCVQENEEVLHNGNWVPIPSFGPTYCTLMGDGSYIGCTWNEKGDVVPVCVE